jgi:nucleotide-binding universal stress UspA family protein
MFLRILSPMDFDENSLAALEYAAAFSRQPGTTLYLLHVVSTDPLHLQQEIEQTTEDEWAAERVARERLHKSAQERLGDCIHYEILVRTGEAVPMILETAVDVEADLIVLSTHGRRGIARIFRGSVAEMVVRESVCPVLSIRGRKGARA